MDPSSAFSHSLIELMVRSTFLLGFACLVAKVWPSRNGSAATRHFLWGMVFLALALLPALSGVLPPWRLLPSTPWTAPPSREVWLTSGSQNVPGEEAEPWHLSANSRPAGESPTEAAPPFPSSPLLSMSSMSDSQVFNPRSEDTLTPPNRWTEQWSFWFVAVWALGVLFSLARLGRAHLHLARWRRRAMSVAGNSRIASVFDQAKRESGLAAAKLSLRLRPQPGGVPLVFGTIHPQVLLPQEAKDWSEERLRAVFLHELAHVRRRDGLVEWGVCLVTAFYWFHPLIRLAARELRHERERSCDDAVLAQSDVSSPGYAEHLLQIVGRASLPVRTPEAALSMADPSQLESRLASILETHRSRKPMSAGARGLALIALVLVTVPIALIQAESKTPDGVTYRLEGLSAEGVHRYLTERFGNNVSIEADLKANSIHVTGGNDDLHREIEKLVSHLDSPGEDGVILMESETDDSHDLEAALVNDATLLKELQQQEAAKALLEAELHKKRAERDGLLAGGLGEKHPKIQELTMVIKKLEDHVPTDLAEGRRDLEERMAHRQKHLAEADADGTRDPRLEDIDRKLHRFHEAIRRYAATHHGPPKGFFGLAAGKRAERELAQLESQLAEVEKELKEGTDPREMAKLPSIAAFNQVQNIVEKLHNNLNEKAQLELRYGARHPKSISNEAVRDLLEEQLRAQVALAIEDLRSRIALSRRNVAEPRSTSDAPSAANDDSDRAAREVTTSSASLRHWERDLVTERAALLGQRAALLAEGLGPLHPKVRGLDAKAEVYRRSAEEASEVRSTPSGNKEIVVTLDTDGQIWLGTTAVNLEQLKGRFTEVRIQVQRDTPFEHVAKRMEELEEAGIRQVRIQSLDPTREP